MFFTTDNRAARTFAAGLDIAIDFATLGEYRVITGASNPTSTQAGRSSDDWATGIEWSAPERTRAACSLPRARNRAWARSRIRA
ncbi:MAG: hypothetical protein WAO61_07680 [Solirubrobacterales bacterium]